MKFTTILALIVLLLLVDTSTDYRIDTDRSIALKISILPNAAAASLTYRRITIQSPQSGDTVRGDLGNIDVKVITEPALNTRAGHKIQILIDGQVQKGQSSAQRGKHTVAARVIDKQGQVLIVSKPVTVFFKQMSRFHPRGPNPAPDLLLGK